MTLAPPPELLQEVFVRIDRVLDRGLRVTRERQAHAAALV